MKALDILVFAVLLVATLVVYHLRVIKPLEMQCNSCVRQVYVVDLDAIVEGAREEALDAALKGQSVSPRAVAEEVRRRLALVLKNLPKNALVLDRSAVINGGEAIVPAQANDQR